MSDNDDLPGGVGLSEAIEALRRELTTAMITGATPGLRFRPGSVELTVEAALTKNVGGKAGIKWWLIEAGAEASRQSIVTQTLKLTLQPVMADSEDQVVDALISGTEDFPDGDRTRQDQPTGAKE